ncbi:MAG: hypothetical protein ACRDIY_07670, partial [Chloroflexota bacterium]
MTNLTDVALAAVGFLTIGAYSGLLLLGAPPESALALALGGGLVLGILASLAVKVVEDGPHPPPLSIGDGEGRDGGGAPRHAPGSPS